MKNKVLLLRSSGDFLGAERVIIELATRLPELGYDPVVGIPLELGAEMPELYKVAVAEGIKVEIFYCKSTFDFGVIKKLKDYIKKENINIVHAHGYREDFYAFFCRNLTRLIATNHLWKKTTRRLAVYATVDAWLLKVFPMVVAVSQPILRDMVACGISEKNIRLISNGIRTSVDSLAAGECEKLKVEIGLENDDLVFVTVSSLTTEKGLNYAIVAFAEVLRHTEKVKLLIVGDGEEAESLKQQARDLGVDTRVIFAGRRSDVSNILQISNVFVLPSLMEGLPMAMLEAMCAAKPILASDVGDVGTALEGGAGIVLKPRDTNQLAENMLVLARDESLRAELGEKARARVLEVYSAAAMAKKYASSYGELLQS